MDNLKGQKIVEKYHIQYKHLGSLGSGQFTLNGVIYEFIWQHYDYQYVIYQLDQSNIRYTICTEPDQLETELFFSTLQDMITHHKYYGTIS